MGGRVPTASTGIGASIVTETDGRAVVAVVTGTPFHHRVFLSAADCARPPLSISLF
jgi:hypothetical protein